MEGSSEISKLKAINKVNIEIWDRLQQYIQTETNAYRFNSINSCSSVRLNFKTLQSVSFNHSCQSNILTFSKTTESIKVEPFDRFFEKNINFFNDTLPVASYFDLSSIIEKYDYLDKVKAGSLLNSWKKALEETQVYLGSLESKILDSLRLSKQAEEIFQEQQEQQWNARDFQQIYFQAKGSSSFSFYFKCEESNLENLKIASLLLHNNYTPTNKY